jgi:glycopeptide antibiotics resistance protein
MSVLFLTIFFVPFRDMGFSNWFEGIPPRFSYATGVNLVPFTIFSDYKIWDRQITGNLVMLTPLGIYIPLLYNNASSLKKVLTLGFVVAASIELLQFVFTFLVDYNSGGYGRSIDIDDVLLNVLGIVIGFLGYKFLDNSYRYTSRRKKYCPNSKRRGSSAYKKNTN